jgi:hypothetical protein
MQNPAVLAMIMFNPQRSGSVFFFQENLMIDQRQGMDLGLENFLVSENAGQAQAVGLRHDRIDGFHNQLLVGFGDKIRIGFTHEVTSFIFFLNPNRQSRKPGGWAAWRPTTFSGYPRFFKHVSDKDPQPLSDTDDNTGSG